MAALSTPVNKVTRENLVVLIRNNVLDNSFEYSPGPATPDVMETDSPMRKPTNIQPIIKKLFHSPAQTSPKGTAQGTYVERSRRVRKRKHSLLPESCERIKRAYLEECDKDGYSPDAYGGMRKKVLISLFHSKEYSMELD